MKLSSKVSNELFLFEFQGSVSGSIQATDRLMKELKNVYKSDSYKSGEQFYKSLLISDYTVAVPGTAGFLQISLNLRLCCLPLF